MRLLPGDDVLVAVEAHVLTALGHDSGRAGVSFLGADRIDVLRFGPDPDGLVRYVTLGMSRAPMTPASSAVVDADGPRAELVLTVRSAVDTVLRRLAAAAASPVVDGVVLGPGASIDLGEPLWDDARCSSLLVLEPTDAIPGLEVEDGAPVRFLPVVPMTPNEAAYKRVHGAAKLQELWQQQETDLTDPRRSSVSL